MQRAVLSLFRGVIVEVPTDFHGVNLSLMDKGIVIDPRISVDNALLSDIDELLTRDKMRLNQTFCTSWSDVFDGSQLDLMWRQIAYYVVSSIKADHLPDFSVSLPPPDFPPERWTSLVYVRAITRAELTNLIYDLCGAFALATETLTPLSDLIVELKLAQRVLRHCRNRELTAVLRSRLGLPPDDSEGYLRYMVHKLTAGSLLIRDRQTVRALVDSDGDLVDKLMADAPCDMADIFLRYKPLFLAMRRASNDKLVFNQLRRRASRTQPKRPFEPFGRSITRRLRRGELKPDEWRSFIDSAKTVDLHRVAMALSMMSGERGDVDMYRIRNGRVWSQPSSPIDADTVERAGQLFDEVYAQIAHRLSERVAGKRISVTKGLDLGLPLTDKQFVGDLPVGTTLNIDGMNCLFSIHWFNGADGRVDLDLSLVDPTHGRVGWGGQWMNDGGIAFSGDIVDAPPPLGAAETLFIRQGAAKEADDGDVKLIYVNFFNYDSGREPVEFSINVADEVPDADRWKRRNYTLPVDQIVLSTKAMARYEQNLIGALVADSEQYRLVFADINIGKANTSAGSTADTTTRYMRRYVRTLQRTCLNGLLLAAGAELIHEPGGDIDLRAGFYNKSELLHVSGLIE